jgi:DNA invertase Pin-like site-specific DNA recombinase
MTTQKRYVGYYRVSTNRQERSGLGLAAQQEAVLSYVKGKGKLIKEYREAESGKRSDRPQLREALAMCRLNRAVLVVAKLDRLARNVDFLRSVVRDSGDGGVVFCDLPSLPEGPTGKFLLTQMASVAELEAGLISQRTKAALAAAKAKGRRLGGSVCPTGEAAEKGRMTAARLRSDKADARAADVLPLIQAIQKEYDGNATLREIAAELNDLGVLTARGALWTSVQVMRTLQRAGQ